MRDRPVAFLSIGPTRGADLLRRPETGVKIKCSHTTPFLFVRRRGISVWRFVIAFGMFSVLSDFVYERPVRHRTSSCPYRCAGHHRLSCGWNRQIRRLPRLALGALADRTKRFWAWTLAEYTGAVISASHPTMAVLVNLNPLVVYGP